MAPPNELHKDNKAIALAMFSCLTDACAAVCVQSIKKAPPNEIKIWPKTKAAVDTSALQQYRLTPNPLWINQSPQTDGGMAVELLVHT